MEIESKSSFSFLVLVYNQEAYIIEHLESIKFLVINYGKNINVDLIINDDCSKDRSIILIDKWLDINLNLFRNVKKIYNKTNLGTCKSVNNLLSANTNHVCKITAADDVYSFENIFEIKFKNDDTVIKTGFAINIYDGYLKPNLFSNILTIATQIIYKKNSLLHRFKHLSINNAPNIFYKTECLKNINVLNYMNKFDVTEDWPLQIAISREYFDSKFELIDKVFVYYRRTRGSTYIVANKRFMNDKNLIYNDLIKNEKKYFERIRLMNRKFCFNMRSKILNKICNLDFYIFFFSSFFNFFNILKFNFKLNLRYNDHFEHYRYIKSRSKEVQLDITSNFN